MATSQFPCGEPRQVYVNGPDRCCSSAVSASIFCGEGSRISLARAHSSSIEVGEGLESAGLARALSAAAVASAFGEGKLSVPPTGGV